jgi:hypothetical protein
MLIENVTFADVPQEVVNRILASLSHDELLLIERYAQNERGALEPDRESDFEWDKYTE